MPKFRSPSHTSELRASRFLWNGIPHLTPNVTHSTLNKWNKTTTHRHQLFAKKIVLFRDACFVPSPKQETWSKKILAIQNQGLEKATLLFCDSVLKTIARIVKLLKTFCRCYPQALRKFSFSPTPLCFRNDFASVLCTARYPPPLLRCLGSGLCLQFHCSGS